MNKKKSQFKPLLFSTTTRNPERLKYFLKVIEKYNGQLLDDNLAMKILKDCMQEKIYFAHKVSKINNVYLKKYSSKNRISDKLIDEVFDLFKKECNEAKKPKERGFSIGASSRFKTCYELARIFGFVWFNEPEFGIQKIELTNLGRELAKCCKLTNIPKPWDIDVVSEKELSIHLHALSKYQRDNPFKRVKNKVHPLTLFFKTVRLLNDDKEIKSNGMTIHELAIFCFWQNNDHNELYNVIRKLRKEHGFNPSEEVILNICDSLTGNTRQNSRQNKSILSEYPDDFMRKLIITGLLSRRGGGRFLDINSKRADLVDYIVKNYSSIKEFNSERSYFNYVSKEDTYLLNYEAELPETVSSNELEKWSKTFGWETIKNELLILKDKKSTKNQTLKEIVSYVRLEWLVSLAIKNRYPHIDIRPNIKTDDEGVPYFQAGGGQFDIEIKTDKNYIFIEATMIDNADQNPREIHKIPRKINDFIFDDDIKGKKTCLVAPKIHPDTEIGVMVLEKIKGIYIKNYDIEKFISSLDNQCFINDIDL